MAPDPEDQNLPPEIARDHGDLADGPAPDVSQEEAAARARELGEDPTTHATRVGEGDASAGREGGRYLPDVAAHADEPESKPAPDNPDAPPPAGTNEDAACGLPVPPAPEAESEEDDPS